MMSTVSVLLDRQVAGQYDAATVDALGHAQRWLGPAVEIRLIPTGTIDKDLILRESAGVVIGPGSPYDNPDGVLAVIRSAREKGLPLVGT
jgi:CTP synthase (UTP-ammonia lyase)